jgi:hypothetical protein
MRGDERAVDRADRGRNDHVWYDALIRQRAKHPDLDRPEAGATREHEGHGAGSRGGGHA